jgi:predicted TIM-barrel fold metal-dependent hydrolase
MAALKPHRDPGLSPLRRARKNWCNVYNDGIAELVKKYPERFVSMASVPLQDPVRAAKVLERAVRDLNERLHRHQRQWQLLQHESSILSGPRPRNST